MYLLRVRDGYSVYVMGNNRQELVGKLCAGFVVAFLFPHLAPLAPVHLHPLLIGGPEVGGRGEGISDTDDCVDFMQDYSLCCVGVGCYVVG